MFSVTSDRSWIFHSGFPELMVANGWKVHLVSGPGKNIDKYRKLNKIQVHVIPMRRNPAPFSDVIALARWINLLRKVRPTVISLGTPKASLLGLIASYLTRVPHRVYVLHGLRLETAAGFYRRMLEVIEKTSIFLATKVVSVGNSLRNRAIELQLVEETKITVLGAGSTNGIELNRFSPGNFKKRHTQDLKKSLGMSEENPVLGFVGRLTPDKGLNVLAEARKILAEWDVQYNLVIIGTQDDATKEDALSKIDRYGTKAIRIGWIEDVSPYYQLFDYLVFPTFREGLSGVVLEALASGVPVIGTNVTGVKDLVVDSINGVLVAPKDSVALAKAVRNCLEAGQVLWDKSAIRNSAQPYSREIVQQNFIDFYTKLPSLE
jgi:glycosyltransferase involved in cell wall biosynthesis